MKLTLKEIVDLGYELKGIARREENGNSTIIMHGLLRQTTTVKFKLILHRIAKCIEKEIDSFEDTKKELSERYFSDTEKISDKKVKEFNEEMDLLFKSEIDVDIESIFSGENAIELLQSQDKMITDEYYGVFMGIVTKL